MKLARVHLRNYRCFDDFLLEVGGGSLLVIGPNAGGKRASLQLVVEHGGDLGIVGSEARGQHRARGCV